MNEKDIVFCSSGSVGYFTSVILFGLFIILYLMYKSSKWYKTSHVRSAAFTRGCLVTLCVVFYSIILMSSCSNIELRPRFLQGFSTLIFGLVLCGTFMAIPCLIAFIFIQVGKSRRNDLWMHLDCVFYICIFFVFPTFVVTLNLWGNSKVLKDLMKSDGNVVTYERSCPGIVDWSINATSNISVMEHVCQFWDKKDLVWSSKGCHTIINNIDGKNNAKNVTLVSCKCNHLTDFAITLEKSKSRLSNVMSKPLDALNVHWLVPFTLAMIFSAYIFCTILCAF